MQFCKQNHIQGECLEFVPIFSKLNTQTKNADGSWFDLPHNIVHSKLRSITHVATKVHVLLRSFVVSTWMRDTIDLV